MKRTLLMAGFVSLVGFLSICPLAQADVGQVIFSEDFEACIPPDWSVDNGLWECCLHSQPPEVPGGGYFYAGTVCDGNYPRYTDSRLISPEIDLTGIVVASDEELLLRFWHWFSYEWGDYGYVQIQVYDETAGTWSAWENISDPIGYVGSVVWSTISIDLTVYAGKKVKIAFYHTDDNDILYASGWGIDKVEVILKAPDLTWDFECGWDDWSADNGVWDIGIPGGGPGKAYSGDQCAGTVLDGNYPRYTNSRLISPTILLDCAAEIRLRFSYSHSYESGDYGVVQISVYEETAETWSAWDPVSNQFTGSSPVWSSQTIDLTAYAGKKVKIAFYHTDDNDILYASGWYLDSVRIECEGKALFPHYCDCDLNQDGVCDMLDYFVFGQDWGRTDCGTPAGSGFLPNDCDCDCNHDGVCDMLDYLRFGGDWGEPTCLTCSAPL